MAVVNASYRGDIRGTALPLLFDLARKPVFLHDNSVPSLDALFNPSRSLSAPHRTTAGDDKLSRVTAPTLQANGSLFAMSWLYPTRTREELHLPAAHTRRFCRRRPQCAERCMSSNLSHHNIEPSPETEKQSSLPEQPDRALVRRLAEGSAPALGAFYDRWEHPVYSLIVRVIKNPDDAELVVEDTFWCAWQTASDYDAARGSVHDWLLKIVRRKTLEYLQSQRRRTDGIDSSIAAQRVS